MHRSCAGKLSLLCLTTLLAACGMSRSLSQPYAEPVGGETSRIRVITNGQVRFIPEQACVDWKRPDVGMVASTSHHVGVIPHLNGRSLGLQPPADKVLLDKGYATSEVLIRAGKPLTLYFDIEEYSGSWKYWCEPMAVSFIPVAGETYEALASMDEYCRLQVRSLTHPDKYPVQRQVEACS